jgi:large subunit ribosomal protein L21
MFAVIKTGGKQYVVKEGDVLRVEKLNAEAGRKVLFEQVLLIEDGDRTLLGMPILDTAVVMAEVVRNFKDDKILVFKKKRRKQYRRTRGHRQPLTEVRIEKIYTDRTAVPADEFKVAAAVTEAKEAAPTAQAIREQKTAAKKAIKREPKPKAEPEEKPKKAPAKAAKPAARPVPKRKAKPAAKPAKESKKKAAK